jgi:amino acid transporter
MTVAEKTDSAAYNKGEFSDTSDRDAESVSGPPQYTTLKRQLKNRHIAMIRCVAFPPRFHEFSPSSSIGGVIGTGLFVGTANALASGGPLGLLLGYIVMGSIVYCVMITLGEMVCLTYS